MTDNNYTLETSQTTAKLDDALLAAQMGFKNAAKDSINPHFKSKYADLGSVWDACRQALHENHILVTQWPIASDDNKAHLITRLSHKGEWMQGRIAIPMEKASAHGAGSAITYAKRFALAAALGIVADEDDDGNAASTASRTASNASRAIKETAADIAQQNGGETRSTYQIAKDKKLTPAELENLDANARKDIAKAASRPELKVWWKAHKAGLVAKLPEADYAGLVVAFDAKWDSLPA